MAGLPGVISGLYNAIFNDPQIQYAGMNQGALRGIPHSGAWGEVYANMRTPVNQLDPVRLGILRSLLAGSGLNAEMMRLNDPRLQMTALRGLNPRDARAY